MTKPKIRILYAQALLAAVVSCSSDEKVDSTDGGSGGEMAAAGTSGNAGSGGASGSSGSPSVGGNGGTAGGISSYPDAPACAVTQGTNEADLTVRRSDISTKRLGTTPPVAIRIAHDPLTGDIVFMTQDGGFWKVDPVSGTSTAIDMQYPGGSDHRGMAFGSDGTLYVLSHVGPNVAVKISKGVPDANGVRTWSTIATSDGYVASVSDFDHRFAGLAVSPDNQWVYFGSGSRTDHGEVQGDEREVALTSAIFRLPTNGVDILLQDNEPALAQYLYADGVRNPFDISFNADGDMFATDNGPDMDLPEEINWIREGKHYGFPWRFGNEDNPVLNPLYNPAGDMRLHVGYQAADRGTYAYDAAFPAPPLALEMIDPIPNHGPDADKFRNGPMGEIEDASDKNQTVAGITAHRSPLGLSFDSEGALCGEYYKSGFLLSYGAVLPVLGEQEHGEDLMMIQPRKVAGSYEMHAMQLVTGFFGPVDSVLVGNKLYVIEYSGNGGGLYEITFPLPEAGPDGGP